MKPKQIAYKHTYTKPPSEHVTHISNECYALVCNTLGKSCHVTSRFFRTQIDDVFVFVC